MAFGGTGTSCGHAAGRASTGPVAAGGGAGSRRGCIGGGDWQPMDVSARMGNTPLQTRSIHAFWARTPNAG